MRDRVRQQQVHIKQRHDRNDHHGCRIEHQAHRGRERDFDGHGIAVGGERHGHLL
jgi:hypothetical protein